MSVHTSLREANRARSEIWGKFDVSWRLNELAGEVGEVCNVLKKLERERLGIPGSRTTTDDLGFELADVAICLDLTLMTIGDLARGEGDLDWDRLQDAVPMKLRRQGPEAAISFGVGLYRSVGSFIESQSVQHHTDMQELAPLVHRLTQARAETGKVISWVTAINDVFCPHTMHWYVERKFNLTSKNVGIPVYLNDDVPRAAERLPERNVLELDDAERGALRDLGHDL